MPESDGRSTRISIRLTREERELIELAARRQGVSRAAFVRQAVVKTARDPGEPPAVITMSPEAFADFATRIDAPGRPVPELVDLFRRT